MWDSTPKPVHTLSEAKITKRNLNCSHQLFLCDTATHPPNNQAYKISWVLTAHKERRSKEMKRGVRSQPDIQCTRSPLSSGPGGSRKERKQMDVITRVITFLYGRSVVTSYSPSPQPELKNRAVTKSEHFVLNRAANKPAQSFLGCQQPWLTDCPVSDSCSGHEVTRYEHHFAAQSIYSPNYKPLSQSIPISEILLQLNTHSQSYRPF